MADQLLPNIPPVTGVNGQYIPNAKVTFYRSGTNTLAQIFEGQEDNAPQLPNPLTADSNGRIPLVFFKDSYQVRATIRNPSGVLIFDVDPCPRSSSVAAAAGGLTFAPTENNDATTVQGAIDKNSDALAEIGEGGTAGLAIFAADTKAAAQTAMGIGAAVSASLGVGAHLFCLYTGPATLNVGDTTDAGSAGVTLFSASIGTDGVITVDGSTALTGVWQCAGYCPDNAATTFIRIS